MRARLDESSPRATARRKWAWGVLVLLALGSLAARPAQAEDCSEFPNGVIDGFAGDIPPSQLQIDRNCTIRNFPASNPLSTNFSFLTQPGQTQERWLIVFDNVVHTGQMACNAVAGHRIWFVNGSSSSIQEGCQNLLIPVEKIDKANPPGPAIATVGVPFTYQLTMPVLYDAGTGTVINEFGSLNDLHSISVTDDLNATGVDLTYVSHSVYRAENGAPVPHSFSNVGGVLTFDNFPIIQSGRQIIVEITVVLDNSLNNTIGKQFINTAKWNFGRLIDDVFYEPLPGEWGISEPLTIGGPELVLTKDGPATLNLGEDGLFTIDVFNEGTSTAWDMTIVDRLPSGPDGGMCDATPSIVSAQVFEADGVTPVAGKGPLQQNADFILTYADSPACELTLTMTSADAAVGADERLVIVYETQLDWTTLNGVMLTNVAGVTEWFNGDSSVPGRQSYVGVVTDGTVGTPDPQDAHTVLTELSGFFFEKIVANVTSGVDPTLVASPGDTLRYTLRMRTTDTPLNEFAFLDDLGALNAGAVFVPGSLTIVPGSLPPGADASNTNPSGGTNGAGLLDVRDMSLPLDSQLQMQFDITLAPSLPNGSFVLNQATLTSNGSPVMPSDDPNVNGIADPDIDGDEDPTQVQIVSAPIFDIDKVSTYITGDPNVLEAGATLRYTITVKNIGTDDAVDVILRDDVPVNTTYVAGSTTLNGVAVADPSAGVSPLTAGMLVNAPENTTPGYLRADASATTQNVATIQFDVVVDPDLIDGTIISNQGFLSAPPSGIYDQPSDDPRTPIANDPTLDVVGSLPLLYAEKSAVLEVDLGTPNVVDPGDTLRYTIQLYNNGPSPATEVVLTDMVPANTTYVADSTTLNGIAVPDGGVSPLVAGLPVSSSDLTPPLPGAGEGTLTMGESAVVQFDLLVDAGVAPGTLIVNQATVSSYELGDVLTDGDGNPATGPEPTVVVVGDQQQLEITKTVAVVGGGPALAGSTVEYTVRVRNISSVPVFYIVITDDLDLPVPAQLAYVDQSATLNGVATGVTFSGSTLTADYGAVHGPLAPAGEALLRFRAVLDQDLPIGTLVTNIADVAWNNPPQTASASVSLTIGGTPGIALMSGTAWHDSNFDDAFDANERALVGWTVELYRDGTLVETTLTDTDGVYRIVGVAPNYFTMEQYELRFSAPGAGANTALLGLADSAFTNYLQRIADIVVQPGDNLLDLNLPIDPNGVIYHSMARTPIAGAIVTLLDMGGAPVPSTCFDDEAQQNQQTSAEGFYRFDLNFSGPGCPNGADYQIQVTAPSASFVPGYSQIIPPTSDVSTGPFDVPSCPGTTADAVPATAEHCEAQTSPLAPGTAVAARSAGTAYHILLTLDDSQPPGSAQLFNNHIPLDPDIADSVTITKTSSLFTVRRGQLVPYAITVINDAGFDLQDVTIVDRFPAGFRYVENSASFDGTPLTPTVIGRELHFGNLGVADAGQHTLQLLLAVGAGVSEGEFVNRAQVIHSLSGNTLSGEAQATVRLVPDIDFDCTDVMGKVFDDVNRNGVQDRGEAGLPGIRLVTANGLAATTDGYGRYHITCATVPNEMRGSNFVLKLDDRTLPTGFRSSTQPVRIERATRGKTLNMNFGASIYRVVGLDVSDPVFVPDSTELRPLWGQRIDILLEELEKAPAVLRLSYLADLEDPGLVEARVDAIERLVLEQWAAKNCCYELEVEPEVFWRLGSPPKR